VVEGGGPIALWHGDAGYATNELHVEWPRHRLHMNQAIWRYERSVWPDASPELAPAG